MATSAPAAGPVGRGYMADQAFYTRYAFWLALFILFAFAQFQLRGFTSMMGAPLFLHVHGLVMIAWLALYVAQSWLISAGQVAVHRKTGWLALGVAGAVVAVGSFTGIHAVSTGRLPPFFTPAFFLALTQIGVLVFAAVVGLAIVKRRDVQWHRRLMIGSGVLITEPALGRLIPMPLVGQTIGELIALGFQLLMVGILARHDRKVLGAIHPATLVIALALVVHHLGIEVLHRVPAFAAWAQSIAAG